MPLDTRYLRAFHAVCETGSFSRASQRLCITQPAVSYQIKMLEQKLRAPLFERVGRRLVLTGEGSALAEFCGRYFSELEVLSHELSQQSPSRTAPLRIAAVRMLGRFVLFPLLCRERFARLALVLTYHPGNEVLRMVEVGECDIGVVPEVNVSHLLRSLPVYRQELVLISPAVGGLQASQPPTPEIVGDLPLITYDDCDMVFSAWFESMLGSRPESTLRAHHVSEIEEVVELVILGRGCSVVPFDAAAAAIDNGTVRVLRADGADCSLPQYLVIRRGAYRRHEITTLVNELRSSSAATGRPVDC